MDEAWMPLPTRSQRYCDPASLVYRVKSRFLVALFFISWIKKITTREFFGQFLALDYKWFAMVVSMGTRGATNFSGSLGTLCTPPGALWPPCKKECSLHELSIHLSSVYFFSASILAAIETRPHLTHDVGGGMVWERL